ncbi:MAG: hypothetical protein JW957_04805 [Candidatus Omnitrophica bacterium]|nr:hypothetical protein [Candidatus Omnitrophota bacterium]
MKKLFLLQTLVMMLMFSCRAFPDQSQHIEISLHYDTPPDQPLCVEPSYDGTLDNLDPTLSASPFSDSDQDDTQILTEWQIFDETGTETILHQTVNLVQLALNPNLSFTGIHVSWGTLEPAARYIWRVRYEDTYGPLWSEWSEYSSFVTADSDEEHDAQQVAPPEDIIDPYVKGAVLSDSTNNETITFACEENITVKSINPDDLPDEGRPDNFIYGMFSIRIDGLAEGKTTVVVTFYVPGDCEDGYWYKHDAVKGWYEYANSVFTYNTPEAPGYTRIDITLLDGGDGDADGTENGVIVDPSGLSYSPPSDGDGGGGGGGGCFIATAAFGSYQERHICILRQFRDNYLLTNTAGRSFVRWYYRKGPIGAKHIKSRPFLRAAARILLYPLIFFAFAVLKGILLPVMAIAVSAGILPCLRKKKK